VYAARRNLKETDGEARTRRTGTGSAFPTGNPAMDGDAPYTYLTGWVTYYRHGECGSMLSELDGWVRGKIRCFRLKRRNRATGTATFIRKQGVSRDHAGMLAGPGKGWRRKSNTPQASFGDMGNTDYL